MINQIGSALQQFVHWLNANAGSLQGVAALATGISAVVALLLLVATFKMARSASAQATSAKDSVDATREILQAEERRRQEEHFAAVRAIYYELVAVATPIGMILIHGDPSLYVPFEMATSYGQLQIPLLRDVPDPMVGRVAKTYSMLAINRSRFGARRIAPIQVELFMNDDLVPTLAALHAHAAAHGVVMDVPPAAVPKVDIVLNAANVTTWQQSP